MIDWPLKLLSSERRQKRDRLVLFDLAADPEERKTIAAERAEDLRRLGALLPKARAFW